MNIYYRRIKTWCPYPFNDEVDTDFVYFSKSKRRFDDQIFLKLSPELQQKERKELISQALKTKKFKLIKY